LGASPAITEFLASNSSGLVDEDGDQEDWIEIFNPDAEPVDLDGWYLTDDASNLDAWKLPPVILQPGDFVVIFASGKNRDVAGSELHTNFKLKAGGEYLALVEPDRITVTQDFGALYPSQITDASYGLAMSTTETTLMPSGSSARWLLPSAAVPSWNSTTFDDSAWTAGSSGFGFENTPADYAGILQTTFPSGTSSAYLRYSFSLPAEPSYDSLSLRVRYDDGFAAWINGMPAESANAPASPVYNSIALAQHPDEEAVEFVHFDVTSNLGDLMTGENVLAVQSLNLAASSDMLFDTTLVALNNSLPIAGGSGFMTIPTPGAGNIFAGPLIADVTRELTPPLATQNLMVAARIDPNAGNEVTGVDLVYRVNFDPEVTVAMSDDGIDADLLAGDGMYSAFVPASAYNPGDLVRWAVRATDVTATSRVPMQIDITGQDQDPAYFGTVVQDPTVTSTLPVLQWFVQNPAAAVTDAGTRASLFYDGEFYDNLFVRRRGASTASWPKHKFKLDFNKSHKFRYSATAPEVEEINLQSHWLEVSIAGVRDAASSYMRETASLQFLRDAGVPAPNSSHIQLRQNGAFYGLYSFVEQVDDTFLNRYGFPVEGAVMYKGVSTGFTRSNLGPNPDPTVYREIFAEDNSAFSQLQALTVGINENNSDRALYVHDHINLPQVINEMATQTVLANPDRLVKNYYIYKDPVTGEWSRFPWDLDMGFGLDTTIAGNQFLTDENFNSPLYGDNNHTQGKGNTSTMNHLHDAILDISDTRKMYVRRVRTLVDQHLVSSYFQTLANGLKSDIQDDADADNLLWGAGDIDDGVSTITRTWLAARRSQLLSTYGNSGSGLIPDAQIASPVITFGTIEFNPPSTIQDEEYIELVNNNAFAVDVSNWQLSGGVDHILAPGTVVPAGGSLYLSPRVTAFRSRSSSPTGGEGNFVQGNFSGHLSNFGEDLFLKRADGSTSAQTATPATPSNSQLYLVISEVMYHPASPNGSAEFIELMNISATVTLDLTGVKFTKGIEFDFPAGFMLAPGEIVLVVRDPAAFEAVYGTGLPIVGTFANLTALNNGGESVKLEDASNSTIQEFTYDNFAPWPIAADGVGYSLVLMRPWMRPDHGSAENWRSSITPGGKPGEVDSTQFTGGDLIDYALTNRPFTFELLNGRLILTHHRNGSADDVAVLHQTSVDLVNWSTATPTLLSEIAIENNLEQKWDFGPASWEQFFVRIEVTIP